MPKIRCPSSSANVCRTLPGQRRSTRQRTNPATSPYTLSAALSRTGPPSETGVRLIEAGDQRLVEQVRKQGSL